MWGALRCLEHRLDGTPDLRRCVLECCHEVGQEPGIVIFTGVQRQPSDGEIDFVKPLTGERRFSIAGRGSDQRQFSMECAVAVQIRLEQVD